MQHLFCDFTSHLVNSRGVRSPVFDEKRGAMAISGCSSKSGYFEAVNRAWALELHCRRLNNDSTFPSFITEDK